MVCQRKTKLILKIMSLCLFIFTVDKNQKNEFALDYFYCEFTRCFLILTHEMKIILLNINNLQHNMLLILYIITY